MSAPVVIVTGARGQLGSEIRDLAPAYPAFNFIFLDKEELDIQQSAQVLEYFEKAKPAFCINCAAYTAVDKAENERDIAMRVNADAVGVLAHACKQYGAGFIHISTDYVFDGTASVPYKEDAATNPVNYYGLTKLKGEEMSAANNDQCIIIRTSWVYSVHGNNFVKTMMRLMKERSSLNVVSDQFGSPTYAADLASSILDIISRKDAVEAGWAPGIYHFSNEGVISWYDFAVAIKTLTGSTCIVNPIPASAYPTPAKRPAYSVFDKEKIQLTFGIALIDWRESLSKTVALLTAPGVS